MLLNTKKGLKGLDGVNLQEITVGKALANIILMVKSDPMRSYVMSQKLYSGEDMELSQADLEWLKTAVKEHGIETYTNALVPGQLMIILADLK